MKIEAGLAKATDFYLQNGFITFTMTPEAVVDHQLHQVNYRIQMKEGEQYRMGRFACAPPVDQGSCDSLHSRWKIKEGDPLNGVYLEEFKTGVFEDWRTKSARGIELVIGATPDSNRKVADVFVVPPRPQQR